ncbi:unnamed protein product [Blepharisma stoltei]|uniref:Uncharacterized protein n=1 Tax=Blepharisma stoltei TaxID=1481888 RepID=A0AAU9JU20_9CILI|nr:unnamed protein product [Blepharisma stoltei]
MRISFYLEESQCQRNCSCCPKTIEKGDLTVRTWYYLRFYFFHLSCYTPGLKQPIYKKDLQIWLANPEKEKIFNLWLEKWNKNFAPINELEIDLPMASKFTYSKPSTYRRAWLETFKFLNAKEIALSISHVNKDFYLISCDEELWYFNSIRDYGKIEPDIRNYREQYILFTLRNCVYCHKNADEDNIVGNLYNKSICKACKGLRRFDKMTVKQIENRYEVDPNLLGLKFDMSVEGWKRTYRFMAIEAIKKNNASFIKVNPTGINVGEENNLDLVLPKTPLNKRIIKIIIVGDSTVGKTSLMNQYVIKRFSEVYRVTIGADYMAKNINIDGKLMTLQIWDKAGWECYFSEEAAFYSEADCCILVYDITSCKSFENLKSLKEKILSLRNDKTDVNFPFIVVGNKVDREDERKISSEIARQWCRENGNIPFYETSAKEYINIDNAFMMIARNVLMHAEINTSECDFPNPDAEKTIKRSPSCVVI